MRIPTSLVLLSGLFLCQPTLAADIKNGKALLDANCFKCHDTSVYQRGDKGRIHSMAALKKQVRRCEQTLGLTWFDDQIDDVSQYLNATFYKFK